MTNPLQTLNSACRLLDEGHFEAATVAVATLAEPDLIAKCLLVCAKGALLEKAGELAAANACFEEAFAHRPPVPAILRACGRYFKRRGDFDKSFLCFATLAGTSPEVLDEFTRDLAGPELCRYAPLLLRRLSSGPNPRFYGMQPVKEALARELGAAGAAHAFDQLTGEAAGKRTQPVRLRGLQDFAREAATLYEELCPRKRVQLPPTNVFGAPDLPGLVTEARAFFLSVLRRAVVTAKSNIVLVGDEALLDYQADELDKVPLDLDVDPIVVSAAGDRLVVSLRDPVASRGTLPEALSLTGVHSHDFGHWMVEFLPKLWACLERRAFLGVPVIVDAAMPAQHLEALRLFAGPDHPVIVLARGESVLVERLWAPSMIVYMPLGPKPGADCARDLLALDARCFVDLVARRSARLPVPDRPDGSRRIYLARKDSQHRKLVNREEVEVWLAKRDFEILHLDTLSFAEQIARIRAADVILGATGSSFFMCFFARPGTLVGELSHQFLEDYEWYSAICRELQLEYSAVCGELCREDPRYRTFSDYRVGTRSLSQFLSLHGVQTIAGDRQKILAFLGVKDEVELIAGAIANLRAIDVDAIAVADLGSTDGTLEILRSLEDRGVIALVEYDENDDKFSSMDAPQFRSLLQRFEPHWIMLSDADERWIPECGSIRGTIAHHDADILVVNRFNVPLTAQAVRQADEIGVREDCDFIVSVDGPLVSEELFLRDPGVRWSLAVDAPRVLFRADAALSFDAGQHAVVPSKTRDLSVKIASDVFVAHLPITSETRFAGKLANVSRYLKSASVEPTRAAPGIGEGGPRSTRMGSPVTNT